jgi:hypothetical protein
MKTSSMATRTGAFLSYAVSRAFMNMRRMFFSARIASSLIAEGILTTILFWKLGEAPLLGLPFFRQGGGG